MKNATRKEHLVGVFCSLNLLTAVQGAYGQGMNAQLATDNYYEVRLNGIGLWFAPQTGNIVCPSRYRLRFQFTYDSSLTLQIQDQPHISRSFI